MALGLYVVTCTCWQLHILEHIYHFANLLLWQDFQRGNGTWFFSTRNTDEFILAQTFLDYNPLFKETQQFADGTCPECSYLIKIFFCLFKSNFEWLKLCWVHSHNLILCLQKAAVASRRRCFPWSTSVSPLHSQIAPCALPWHNTWQSEADITFHCLTMSWPFCL